MTKKLFEEFPPITTEEWKTKIVADLKGADYDKKLVWKTDEGFSVQPFYRSENVADLLKSKDLPGSFPYTRGVKAKGNDWLIRQEIKVVDTKSANQKAKWMISKGVTSLGFKICCKTDLSTINLAELLDGIDLSKIEINFVRCNVDSDYINFVNSVIGSKELKGAIEFDPITHFAMKGAFKVGETEAFAAAKSLLDTFGSKSGFRALYVNAKKYKNAGCTSTQELAFALSIGVEYLDRLTEQGLDADAIAKNIKFSFGVGGNYFVEIAKLRAARTLWAKLTKAYGVTSECASKMKTHSETIEYNKTVYDSYVNMLRTQTESMSAVLGGTDSLTVLPFDSVYAPPSEFSEKVARNQQHLLSEESHFANVADPSAGSYYIEELTDKLAASAWELFLEIQDNGGFIASLRSGRIQDAIEEVTRKRDLHIAQRRVNILGVNQFPNFTEAASDKISADMFEVGGCCGTDQAGEIRKVVAYRGAMEFEKLRFATDQYSKNNKRPLVYMLTIGNLAMRKARAQFACNFFAAAGFAVQDNNGFNTVAEGVEAAKAAGASIIVLCSSDDEYAQFAPEAHALIGDKVLVVAGAPACADELKSKGITNFINVRSNALEELKAYQKQIIK
ncbi:MAG: methylmalonyl-CoA mutase family protein [Bacteroidales bacterium]